MRPYLVVAAIGVCLLAGVGDMGLLGVLAGAPLAYMGWKAEQ